MLLNFTSSQKDSINKLFLLLFLTPRSFFLLGDCFRMFWFSISLLLKTPGSIFLNLPSVVALIRFSPNLLRIILWGWTLRILQVLCLDCDFFLIIFNYPSTNSSCFVFLWKRIWNVWEKFLWNKIKVASNHSLDEYQ